MPPGSFRICAPPGPLVLPLRPLLLAILLGSRLPPHPLPHRLSSCPLKWVSLYPPPQPWPTLQFQLPISPHTLIYSNGPAILLHPHPSGASLPPPPVCLTTARGSFLTRLQGYHCLLDKCRLLNQSLQNTNPTLSIPGADTSSDSHCSEDKDQTPHHGPQGPACLAPARVLGFLCYPLWHYLLQSSPSYLPAVSPSALTPCSPLSTSSSFPRTLFLNLTLSQSVPSLLSETPVLVLRHHEIVQHLCSSLDCKPLKARGGSPSPLLHRRLPTECPAHEDHSMLGPEYQPQAREHYEPWGNRGQGPSSMKPAV